MLTRAIEVQKYVRASAGRAGISIVFEEINQPRHDGKTIYLPQITAKTTLRDLQQLMASTDHEVAHDRFSSFDVLKKVKVKPKSLVMFVWNFIEDSRVNMIEAQEYRGFKENWDDCNSELIAEIIKRASGSEELLAKLTLALMRWESVASKATFPKCEFATHSCVVDEKIYDVLNNFTNRLLDCQKILDKEIGTQSAFDLAHDILTQLGEECKEEFEKAASKARASEPSSADDGEGEDSDGSESEASESSTGEAKSDTKKENDEYKVIEQELTEEDLLKYCPSLHSEEMGKVGVNHKPVAIDKGHWDMTDFDKFIVVNYPKRTGFPKYFSPSYSFKGNYQDRVGSSLVTQENFAQQVRKLIQIRARVQTQYGVKKGKLDQSRLSRLCFNTPGFSERIFKNRIENKTLDAAVSVLVDMSGSMGGEKVLFACAAALLMSEVCSTLGIPLEINGFTDGLDRSDNIQPIMFIYKSFADLKVNQEDLLNYFSCSSNHLDGNPDGENILWAHERLLKRKEKRKLLIVMSDGCPCASKDSFGVERFTKKVIEEIEASKSVEIYGLGLLSSDVRSYYKANSVVNKVAEIPSKLLELIERKLLNV